MRRTAAAVVAGAALVLSGCTGAADDAAIGDVVQGRTGDLSGVEHVVQLPSGRVRITLGKPTDAVSAEDAADGQEHAAPDGGDWVAVDWHFEPGAGLSPFTRSVMAEDDGPRTTLTLSADDETYRLGDVASTTKTPADTRTSGIVHVALPSGADPVLTVDFDGVTARVDTGSGEVTGELADALADPAEPVSGDCGGGDVAGGRTQVACTWTVTTVPYLPGHGWSDTGWTVAQAETRVDGFTRHGSRYTTSAITDASELTGAAASTSEVVDARLTTLVARAVAEGPATGLSLVRTVQGTKVAGSGPDTASVTWTTTVPLSGPGG
ncbi:hypothetical protein QI633_05410 [Nocardioides sp. QY071]|uniref:hypothetical protein n=1 Tax=Nocardioides sp. QY071 TaxID=3044187 RepID=UPI002499ADED|nr:hypothetical protein [Nocardioides sp. QY071]WGY03194.1 hypothetical protein QI633_05410 [Nocardioides sp. QY071]